MKNIFFRRWLVSLCFVAACIVVPNVEAQIITTIAGTGTGGFGGDNGPATSAIIYQPSGVFVDRSDNLYIADLSNERIRKVDVNTGIITTIAGSVANFVHGQ